MAGKKANNKSKKKVRSPIPPEIGDEVLFRADYKCCVCGKRGHQIHHIDENPNNHDIDNLILLCIEHHNEVTTKGGLIRKLTPGTLRRYREFWYRKVEASRHIPVQPNTPNDKHQADYDQLFSVMSDALACLEIRKVREKIVEARSNIPKELIHQLYPFLQTGGIRARGAILDALSWVTASATFPKGLSADVVRALAQLVYETIPITIQRPHRKEELSKKEVQLLYEGAGLGHELAYNGGLRLKDISIVDSGCEMLWYTSRFAQINKLKELYKSVLDDLGSAEDAGRRGGDPDIYTLMQIYRKHAMTDDRHHPPIPDRLIHKIAYR